MLSEKSPFGSSAVVGRSNIVAAGSIWKHGAKRTGTALSHRLVVSRGRALTACSVGGRFAAGGAACFRYKCHFGPTAVVGRSNIVAGGSIWKHGAKRTGTALSHRLVVSRGRTLTACSVGGRFAAGGAACFR